MKRIALLACAVALLGASTGCGQVKAGDGDLVDDWGMLAAAKVPEPEAGSCWTSTATDVADAFYTLGTQKPCDMEHSFETAKVGHFTGDAASGSASPQSAKLADAWKDCSQAADDYLGAQWQDGRVVVLVRVPPERQWDGGARYYRCDIAAVRSEFGKLDPRTTTMKGALAKGGDALRLGCGTQVGVSQDSWDDITATPCDQPHDTEYVGTVTSPGNDYPADEKAYDAAFGKTCEAKMLSYIGMSRNSWASQKALYYGYWMTANKADWAAGNHTARCYAMVDKKKISRSLKGAGNISV
ncbi:septum formation family protein [Dactylosporangium sp. CA-233914]|uniref:septum formation family protein n=1 Tax=Dactylosporangium sp. CA-233914 TaxID=3239934 RepID=UPI003D8EBE2E